MTYKEFHTAFNIQLDKAESISHPAFLSKEKDYWINTAIRNIVKTRFSGTNPLHKGFQQDQKRTDDLRFLVKTATYKTFYITWTDGGDPNFSKGDIVQYTGTSGKNSFYKSKTNSNTSNPYSNGDWLFIENMFILQHIVDTNIFYTDEFPNDYWFTLGENVDICEKTTDNLNYPDGYKVPGKTMDVTECTIDNITSKANNSLSDHHLRNGKAKPLRLFTDNQIQLYVDEADYYVDNYQLVYLAKPKKFERTIANEDYIYDGMPEHIHDEIVAYAVRLALGSIGDERYQIQSAENQIIE